MLCMILGDNITVGIDGILSQPVLKESTWASFRTRPSNWDFLQPKTFIQKKKLGKTLQFSLKIRPRSPNHPSLEKQHKFIPIFIDIMRATHYQINGAEKPCAWATWLGLLRRAHHTPHSAGCEMHLLRWEEMFLWHLILLACCTWN